MKYDDIKEIWIEAEQWSEGFSIENQTSDVLVYTDEGKQWVGTFVIPREVNALKAEVSDGDIEKQFWVNDMVVVECLDRIHIEAAIRKMLEEDSFNNAFSEYEDI